MWWARSEPVQAWVGGRHFAWSGGGEQVVHEVASVQQALDLLAQRVTAGGVKTITVWLSSQLSKLEAAPAILGAKHRDEAVAALRACRGDGAGDEQLSLQLPTWPMTGACWPLAVTDAVVLKSIEATCRKTKLSIKPWWSWALSHDDLGSTELLSALFDGEALLSCFRRGNELVHASTVPMSDIEHVRRAVERRRFGLSASTLVCSHLELTQRALEAARSTGSFAFESFIRSGVVF